MFGVRSLGIGLGVLSSGKGFGVPCSGFGVCGWDRGSDSGYGVWGSGTMFGYVVRGLGYVVHCLGFESPPCRELGAPPVRQISSSFQRLDLAGFVAPRCSVIGEPCAELPCFKAPSPGRSRLCEARKRHWRLPGFSSTPALPLHLGPKRP